MVDVFHTDSALAQGLHALIEKLQVETQLSRPIRMIVAGGMAVHLYTGTRVTTDVDAEFSHKLLLPENLLVETTDGDMLYLDTNYNSTFALMHPNYADDAIRVPLGTDLISLYILSPVDLILSKLARFHGPDAQDIQAMIKVSGVSEDEISRRAEEALIAYVGNQARIRTSLTLVLKMARDVHDSDQRAHGAQS